MPQRCLQVRKELLADIDLEKDSEELKAELNALVAGVDVERYAVEKLGLVKVSSENEVYINNETVNKIVFSAQTE